MAGLEEQIRENREAILEIARRNGVRTIRIFGSVARRESTSNSDVDFLVEMEPGRSLLDMGGLLMDLQDLLGCRVDVVSQRGLSPYLRDSILDEAVPV